MGGWIMSFYGTLCSGHNVQVSLSKASKTPTLADPDRLTAAVLSCLCVFASIIVLEVEKCEPSPSPTPPLCPFLCLHHC